MSNGVLLDCGHPWALSRFGRGTVSRTRTRTGTSQPQRSEADRGHRCGRPHASQSQRPCRGTFLSRAHLLDMRTTAKESSKRKSQIRRCSPPTPSRVHSLFSSPFMSSPFPVAMPRPAAPPTPQPSTEITSKSDGHATHVDSSFALPPAALGTSARGSTTSSTSSNASDSSYNPNSPHASKPSPPNSRKRPSTLLETSAVQDGYTLPPPPTRSRKIIQMKPKSQQSPPLAQEAKPATSAAPTGTTAKAGGGKKKQSNGTTAAGRKIARKTAHSLIERRRRSKMNEEFGVLKDMIPACAGQEMHKLAILQVRTSDISTFPIQDGMLTVLSTGQHRIYALPRAMRCRPQSLV